MRWTRCWRNAKSIRRRSSRSWGKITTMLSTSRHCFQMPPDYGCKSHRKNMFTTFKKAVKSSSILRAPTPHLSSKDIHLVTGFNVYAGQSATRERIPWTLNQRTRQPYTSTIQPYGGTSDVSLHTCKSLPYDIPRASQTDTDIISTCLLHDMN